MTIAERKEREKEVLKESILDAAMHIFTEKGFSDVSMRNIAERIDYSPTTIYLYFKDKNAVLYALHSRGFKMLREKLSVFLEISHPFERLNVMGKAYIEFALEHPRLYDLMFIIEEPMDCIEETNEHWMEGKNALHVLIDTLKDCMTSGYFPDEDPEVLAVSIWSFLHGLCALKIRGRLNQVISEQNRESIINQCYDNFARVLQSNRV
jgi:AcrR family transcriptional regulator